MNKVYQMRVSLILEEKMDGNLDIKISNIDGKIQPSKYPKADQLSKVLHKYLTMVQGSYVTIQQVLASLP